MSSSKVSGNQIRQTFIDFFKEKGHTFVPSSSLVPGGDQTLLFTNAGMVQFKDVFLGTDMRSYSRAVNSQKCMRVAGKHNDLDDVGRDDTHHTFFEMLGNWSFGDYYKKEAISWAWELLTEVWQLPKDRFWATCFRDEKGEIPTDEEATTEWKNQPGFDSSHVLFFGRKDNFWEMAETGPCGPCSEIHFDRGPEYCDKKNVTGHTCQVNGDCPRFLELWNLVFIQYKRLGPTQLEPLPAKHVDTGLGFARIVSVLQDRDSNYSTDLFTPLIDAVQKISSHSRTEREQNMTPYRVIADHARAATFLIADGVVPGNTGRNYICRMIIRRAARFGSNIGLNKPFLSSIAKVVIENYGDFYPELKRSKNIILDNLTREETQFQRTVEGGIIKLDSLLEQLKKTDKKQLPGEKAFDLYATYGLPLEITRDIARELDLNVDEAGFISAMEEHRLASGAGETFGELGGEDVEVYRKVRQELQEQDKLGGEGVGYRPYDQTMIEGHILAIIKDGRVVKKAESGDKVEIILPDTCFYIEAGGQVSDTGTIKQKDNNSWEIRIDNIRKPAAGIIVHIGEVVSGSPEVDDTAIAYVDVDRRQDIMRNHTATHLLHAELRTLLGEQARQAGSLVAPDHLRFDFTHPNALSTDQLRQIEAEVNTRILQNYPLNIAHKPLKQAIDEGATALFGEKYDKTVRNITIGEPDIFSNELCGGTHVKDTGDIGLFLIQSEGSTAAGVRRIVAVTGMEAYKLVQERFHILNKLSDLLDTSPDNVYRKVGEISKELRNSEKQLSRMRKELVTSAFIKKIDDATLVAGTNVLVSTIPNADMETLRAMLDNFRERYPNNGVAVLASVKDERPILVAGITKDLVERGLHAGELVNHLAQPLGGGGGGRPTMAQAGGENAEKLDEVLNKVNQWVESKII